MPVAGVVWQTLHYLVGFQRLGFDVVLRRGARADAVDADARARRTTAPPSPPPSSPTCFGRFGLGDRWAYHALHDDGRCYGMSERELPTALRIGRADRQPPRRHRAAARARRDRPARLPRDRPRAAPDRAVRRSSPRRSTSSSRTARSSPSARTTAGPDCGLPVVRALHFRPTRQPVVLDFWLASAGDRRRFTTVGNWRQPWREVTFAARRYTWSKHHEFRRFSTCRRSTGRSVRARAERATTRRPRAACESHGWRVRTRSSFSTTSTRYRDYIGGSRAEFTVAKDQNVRLRTGWFSDRSATYLAAGRPVVTQDTASATCCRPGRAFRVHRPSTRRRRGRADLRADYPSARRAAEIARESLRRDVVLGRLLDDVGVSVRRPAPTRPAAVTISFSLPMSTTAAAPELGEPSRPSSLDRCRSARRPRVRRAACEHRRRHARQSRPHPPLPRERAGEHGRRRSSSSSSTTARPTDPRSYLTHAGASQPARPRAPERGEPRLRRPPATRGSRPLAATCSSCSTTTRSCPRAGSIRLAARLDDRGRARRTGDEPDRQRGRDRRRSYDTYGELSARLASERRSTHAAARSTSSARRCSASRCAATSSSGSGRSTSASSVGHVRGRRLRRAHRPRRLPRRLRRGRVRPPLRRGVVRRALRRRARTRSCFDANRRRFEEKWGTPWQPLRRRHSDPSTRVMSERVRRAVTATLPRRRDGHRREQGRRRALELAGRRGLGTSRRLEDGVYAGHHPADARTRSRSSRPCGSAEGRIRPTADQLLVAGPLRRPPRAPGSRCARFTTTKPASSMRSGIVDDEPAARPPPARRASPGTHSLVDRRHQSRRAVAAHRARSGSRGREKHTRGITGGRVGASHPRFADGRWGTDGRSRMLADRALVERVRERTLAVVPRGGLVASSVGATSASSAGGSRRGALPGGRGRTVRRLPGERRGGSGAVAEAQIAGHSVRRVPGHCVLVARVLSAAGVVARARLVWSATTVRSTSSRGSTKARPEAHEATLDSPLRLPQPPRRPPGRRRGVRARASSRDARLRRLRADLPGEGRPAARHRSVAHLGHLRRARRRVAGRVLHLHRRLRLRLAVRDDRTTRSSTPSTARRSSRQSSPTSSTSSTRCSSATTSSARSRNTLPDAPIVYTLHEFLPICHRHGQMVRTIDRASSATSLAAALPRMLPGHLAADLLPAQALHPVALRARRPLPRAEPVPARRYVDWGIPREQDRRRGVRPPPPRPMPAATIARSGRATASASSASSAVQGRRRAARGDAALLGTTTRRIDAARRPMSRGDRERRSDRRRPHALRPRRQPRPPAGHVPERVPASCSSGRRATSRSSAAYDHDDAAALMAERRLGRRAVDLVGELAARDPGGVPCTAGRSSAATSAAWPRR